MLILGHRGLSGHFPDNTMIAYQRAFDVGSNGVELDVQMTKDGELVLFHDFELNDDTDGYGRIDELTLEAIQQYTFTSSLQTGLIPQVIPTVRQYLDWVYDKSFVTNFEIKVDHDKDIEIERKLLVLLEEYHYIGQSIISSFSLESIKRMRQLNKEIQIGYLVADYTPEALELCIEHGFDYLHPNLKDLSQSLILKAKDNDIGLNVWTVNDYLDYQNLIHWQVNGIISDYPDRVVSLM